MGSVDQDRPLVEEIFYNPDSLFQPLSLAYLVKSETFDSTRRNLTNNIVVLLEVKSFDDLCFHPLLVTVARSCSEANTKLSINELRESFGLFKHNPIRLIDKDQGVSLRLKITSDAVLNFFFAAR